jgi:tetratricopeptide (TPR) repeat protein
MPSRRWTKPSSFRASRKTSGTSGFLRGATFEREKHYSEAEEQFQKVLASDPENAAALNYLGYMLADQNMKLEEALGYIKRAVDLDPTNGAYLDSLGWAYFRLGKYELAEDNLLKASQKINTDPTVHDHLGDLYQKTGRLKLAATNWERALTEWNRMLAADVDPADQARVQKKLDSAKMKLAREEGAKQYVGARRCPHGPAVLGMALGACNKPGTLLNSFHARRLCGARRKLPRTPPSRAVASLPQRLSARPRPCRPCPRLSPAGSEDAGFHPPLLRPLPQPPDAHHRGRANLAHHRRATWAEHRSGGGAGAGARSRPSSVRPLRRKSARLRHAPARLSFDHNSARAAHCRGFRTSLRCVSRI